MTSGLPPPTRQRIRGDGSRESLADDTDTLSRVADGEILVVRGALHELGVFTPLTKLTLAAIEAAAGAEVARSIEKEGFESIHRHMSGAEIEAAYLEITSRLKGHEPGLVQRFLKRFGSPGSECFAAEKSWVRIFVPHDHYAQHRARFDKRVGHLRFQNPHRDSWFTNPRNAVVLWAALSPVRAGNGMVIFPSMWNRPIAHRRFEESGSRTEESVRPGQPVDFELDPGDVLLFSGEHFHSSELNSTDQTRLVISFRVTMGKPVYGEGARWISYVPLQPLTPARMLLAKFRGRLNRAYLRHLLERRLIYALTRISVRRGPRLRDSSTTTAAGPPLAERAAPPPSTIVIPKLEKGVVTALSESYCATLTDQGGVLFERHCPHQGGDLANGWIDGSSIRCPMHNLTLHLTDSRPPCGSIRKLEVYQLRPLTKGSDIFFVAPARTSASD